MDRLFVFAALGVSIGLAMRLARYCEDQAGTRKRLMTLALASACWGIIALSFAVMAFAVRTGHDLKSGIEISMGSTLFLICSWVSVRSFLRLRKLAAAS